MANMRYFADINGGTVELERVWNDGRGSKAKHFFGHPKGTDYTKLVFVKGRKTETGCDNAWSAIPATRVIEYKSFPSKHKCDARCTSAKGFRCECECGGKNHGAGSFACEAA
jgi:hypothetical protein